MQFVRKQTETLSSKPQTSLLSTSQVLVIKTHLKPILRSMPKHRSIKSLSEESLIPVVFPFLTTDRFPFPYAAASLETDLHKQSEIQE